MPSENYSYFSVGGPRGTDGSSQVMVLERLTRSLFKLMTIESVMPSNHLILCLLLLLLPSVFSSIRVFASESALHIRWPGTVASSPAPARDRSSRGRLGTELNWRRKRMVLRGNREMGGGEEQGTFVGSRLTPYVLNHVSRDECSNHCPV